MSVVIPRVPHRIYTNRKAAAEILITDPPTTAFTHLEDIQSDKYLGVVLDNRLSFNNHTDEITKKKQLTF